MESKPSTTLILSRSEKGTLELNARNTIQGDFCCQEKAQLNPLEQNDSATLLLKSSKSLLQMHETENYCKQTWETK